VKQPEKFFSSSGFGGNRIWEKRSHIKLDEATGNNVGYADLVVREGHRTSAAIVRLGSAFAPMHEDILNADLDHHGDLAKIDPGAYTSTRPSALLAGRRLETVSEESYFEGS
jgi:hypothetical protein